LTTPAELPGSQTGISLLPRLNVITLQTGTGVKIVQRFPY